MIEDRRGPKVHWQVGKLTACGLTLAVHSRAFRPRPREIPLRLAVTRADLTCLNCVGRLAGREHVQTPQGAPNAHEAP